MPLQELDLGPYQLQEAPGERNESDVFDEISRCNGRGYRALTLTSKLWDSFLWRKYATWYVSWLSVSTWDLYILVRLTNLLDKRPQCRTSWLWGRK